MRKILNLLLVFMLSAVIVGVGFNNVKAEATTDVTINLHIHQLDGDYTNTGTGSWDGIQWNNWTFDYGTAYATVTQSTDDFGKLISITYTANQINAVSDEIEYKPTRNVNVDEAANYLAPGDGKVFADVTALKDGLATTLDLYYVEGASEWVVGEADLGLLFVVYADPLVATGDPVYEGWEMWSWSNGSTGTIDLLQFNQELSFKKGIYNIEGRLGVIKVSADASGNTGFKFRFGEWVEQTAEYSFDNTAIRGSGAAIIHVEKGVTPYHATSAEFINSVFTNYELNAGNKFVDGTIVSSPTTIEVSLLMPQNPAGFDVSRFTLLDGEGNSIPILSAVTDTMANLGTFTSDVTCEAGENHFVLYVTSALEHSKLGLVGSLQGWNPGAAILSTKDDSVGNAVFEVCTSQANGEYKVLYDPAGDGFTWDGNMDPNVTKDNQMFDFEGNSAGVFYIDANIPTVSSSFVGTYVSDFTPEEGQKTVIIHFETTEDHSKLGVVGAFAKSWNVGEAYLSTKDDTSGYAVFEVPTLSSTGEFKIKLDGGDPGFTWDGVIDPELTIQLAYDMGDADSVEIFINAAGDTVFVVDGTAVSTPLNTNNVQLTVAPENALEFGEQYYVHYNELLFENYVTVFVDSELDHSKLGLVGTFQGWDISSPLLSTKDDENGNAVFELALEDASGEFVVVYNDTLAFTWDDKISGNDNLVFEVDGSTAVLFDMVPPMVAADEVGTFVSDFTPTVDEKTLIIHFETTENHSLLGVVGNFVKEWNVTESYLSTKDDTLGYAVFELPVPATRETGEFKIKLDGGDAGFTWDGGVDPELTVQLAYDFNGESTLEIFIDATGTVAYIVEGSPLPSSYPIYNAEPNMADYGAFEREVFPMQYVSAVTESSVLEFATSNNFVAADVINETGTYAATPTSIMLQFLNAAPLMNDIELVDGDGNLVPIESVGYGLGGIGEYTELRTCVPSNFNKLTIYLNLNTITPTDLNKIGVVGSIQGWNPSAAIEPIGMDSSGNYVFEICVTKDDGITSAEFKILFDSNGDGFAWGDVEVTPGNVVVALDGAVEYYIEEGQTSSNTSSQKIVLLDANKLDITKTYQLRFTDENGFEVFIDLDLDDTAPFSDFTVKANTPLEIEQWATFNIMDFYNKFDFIDNRDGEVDYVVVTNIDTSVPGAQSFVVTATDAWNNVTTKTINFTVLDADPVITGTTSVTFTAGDDEPDWTTYVTTNEGTISVDTSQVDMDTAGVFFVRFTATDAGGNKDVHSLEVTIEEGPAKDTGCGASINVAGSVVIALIAVAGVALVIKRKF